MIFLKEWLRYIERDGKPNANIFFSSKRRRGDIMRKEFADKGKEKSSCLVVLRRESNFLGQ